VSWLAMGLGWLEMVEVTSLRAGRETVCPRYVVVGKSRISPPLAGRALGWHTEEHGKRCGGNPFLTTTNRKQTWESRETHL